MFRGWTVFVIIKAFELSIRKWQVKLSRLANRSPKIFNMVKFDVLKSLIRLTPEGGFFHGNRLLGLVPFSFTLGGLSPCRDLALPKFHPHTPSICQEGAPAMSAFSSCQSSPGGSSAGALYFAGGVTGGSS